MYRYSVDNAVTYTSEDFVLFRESPFACWMERLSLENPDHGIPPDVGSCEPPGGMERQDDIVDTLRAEGRDVALIDWDIDESRRRVQTLEAMRGGADFIVNGQLALGPLSGSVNLLMRTSGYSELGDYLYVPCDTQAVTTLHSAFRLCFLADLLHSLQGQLPPQMLIIRGGLDVVPLQTEDHIYYYRAVKQRFMQAMRDFRKHRMPDPAESSHFGRWSECANEVLKQRALRGELPEHNQPLEEAPDEDIPLPRAQAAGAVVAERSCYDPDQLQVGPLEVGAQEAVHQATGPIGLAQEGADQTLLEQARLLTPDSYTPGPGRGAAPGPTPNLARAREVGLVSQRPEPDSNEHDRRSSNVALQNLEFIGSSDRSPIIGGETAFEIEKLVAASVAAPEQEIAASAATMETESPAPALTASEKPEAAYSFPEQGEKLVIHPPDSALGRSLAPEAPAHPVKPHPLDSVGFSIGSRPAADMTVIDMDAAPPPTLNPTLATQHAGFEPEAEATAAHAEDTDHTGAHAKEASTARFRSFNDSLVTNEEYEG